MACDRVHVICTGRKYNSDALASEYFHLMLLHFMLLLHYILKVDVQKTKKDKRLN